MRTNLVVFIALLSLAAVPVCAEETLLAKVYRDYPGYINPAVCENPNFDGKAGKTPVAQSAEAIAAPAGSVPVKSSPAVPDTAPEPAQGSASPRKCCPDAISLDQADDPVGHYLAAWGGVVATHDTDIEGAVDISFDNGYGAGVAIGYDFGPARIEIEASHRDSHSDKLEIGGIEVDRDADFKVQALMLNGFADFATGGPITPYLGAGVGYAKVELDDEDDNVLAGQLAAGALYAFSPTVAIDLGYRFMMTDDPDVEGADYEVRQHTAMLGLQLRF